MMEHKELLEKMVELLTSIDGKLEILYSKVDQIEEKLDEIQGDGVYNTITDVCDKLDDIQLGV